MQRYRLIRKREGNNVFRGSSKVTYLIVLDRYVRIFFSFLVRNLRKEPTDERLSDVHVVPCLVFVWSRHGVDPQTFHVVLQAFHVVSLVVLIDPQAFHDPLQL